MNEDYELWLFSNNTEVNNFTLKLINEQYFHVIILNLEMECPRN